MNTQELASTAVIFGHRCDDHPLRQDILEGTVILSSSLYYLVVPYSTKSLS